MALQASHPHHLEHPALDGLLRRGGDVGCSSWLAQGASLGVGIDRRARPLYYVYMSLLSTFCTNSINILAGINGVEVGQALVIALSLCLNDVLYLDPRAGQPGSRSSTELLRRHLLSLYLLLPLVGVCMGLLRWNVSEPGVCGRHILLLCRHGFQHGRYPGPLLQDCALVLCTSALQLPPQLSATFWAGA